MSTLHFTRDRPGTGATGAGVHIEMATLLEGLRGYGKLFRTASPHPEAVQMSLPGPDHVNVVVQIEPGEVNDEFPKPGFYWYPQLMPWKCRELLSLAPNEPGGARDRRRR